MLVAPKVQIEEEKLDEVYFPNVNIDKILQYRYEQRGRKTTLQVYLPQGGWYRFRTAEKTTLE